MTPVFLLAPTYAAVGRLASELTGVLPLGR
jgi:hypothetical protein